MDRISYDRKLIKTKVWRPCATSIGRPDNNKQFAMRCTVAVFMVDFVHGELVQERISGGELDFARVYAKDSLRGSVRLCDGLRFVSVYV